MATVLELEPRVLREYASVREKVQALSPLELVVVYTFTSERWHQMVRRWCEEPETFRSEVREWSDLDVAFLGSVVDQVVPLFALVLHAEAETITDALRRILEAERVSRGIA